MAEDSKNCEYKFTDEHIEELKKEVLLLYWLWNTYKKIYIELSEDKLQVLNRYSYFFKAIQLSMIDTILLRLARLFDPYKQGRNYNLTLEILVHIDESIEHDYQNLKTKVEKAIKKLRDKLLAHNDINSPKLRKEISLSSKDIENILMSLAIFLNKFGNKTDKWNNIDFNQAGELDIFNDIEMLFTTLKKSIKS